jgi:hypothetical protein
MERHLLSTDHEMITARKAVDARVPNFVLNDELLLTPLKAFAVHPLTARIFKMLDVFSLCVEQSAVATNSSPGVTRAARDTPPHLTAGIMSRSVVCS